MKNQKDKKTSLEQGEEVREAGPVVRGGLPIWGWGMIALGGILVIGAAIFATVPGNQPMRTPLPKLISGQLRVPDAAKLIGEAQ